MNSINESNIELCEVQTYNLNHNSINFSNHDRDSNHSSEDDDESFTSYDNNGSDESSQIPDSEILEIETSISNIINSIIRNHNTDSSDHTLDKEKTHEFPSISNFQVSLHGNSNSALTGVIVNGFHPQLFKWKSPSSSSERCNLNSDTSTDRQIQERVSRLRMDQMKQLEGMHSILPRNRNINMNMDMDVVQQPKDVHVPTMVDDTNVLKIYSDVFEHSKVPQLIAAPGGRIAAANQKFFQVFGEQSLHSLTAFDVVEPSMIPKLYEIFLIALQPFDTVVPTTMTTSPIDSNGTPCCTSSSDSTKDQKEDVKYQSLTVPCKNNSYYITFSLMYDKDPSKRCFHCIFFGTRNNDVPIGEIYVVSQNWLLEKLQQS